MLIKKLSMKSHIITLFIALSLICECGLAQKTVEGIRFDEKVTYNGETLVLNGAGLREKWFLDLYVAGLYLNKRDNNATNIINANSSFVMSITIVSSLITGEKMAEATKEGFIKAMNGDISSLEKEINSFIGVFESSSLSKGDHCNLKYSPEKGLEFYINNTLKKTIEKPAFKKALLRVWLGPNSVDETLKKQLLNL